MLVHGANIEQKEQHHTKYQDPISKTYLAEIHAEYNAWFTSNNQLVGPKSIPDSSDESIIARRVQLLEEYKDFIDQQKYAEHFDSRSNLHSTVLEEFIYYLLRDLVADFDNRTLIGKSRSFKDIFFTPPNYETMISRPHARVERKDHDFVIGVTIQAHLRTVVLEHSSNDQNSEPEVHQFDIPAVVIECKTYLDKTMLEGASRAAEELKARTPNALYIVAMEWLKLTDAVNLRKYKVDQVYVLRRQRNTDREFRFTPTYVKNPIDPSVVWHLFKTVRSHLTTDWESGIQHGLERGWLL